jgi:hypothetical protein
LLIPNDTDLALTLQGKKDKIDREDFVALADYLEIPERVRFARFENKLSRIKQLVKGSSLPTAMQDEMVTLIQSRYQRLNITP